MITTIELRKAISKVKPFMASEKDVREAIKGVAFVIKNEKLTLIATDACRIAFVKLESVIVNRKDERTYLVPISQLVFIESFLDRHKKTEIFFLKHQIELRNKNERLSINTTTNTFPDVFSLIPNNPVALKIKRLTLLDAIIEIQGKDFNPSKIIFSSDSLDVLKIISGDNQKKLKYCNITPFNDISFNSSFIVDLLLSLEDEIIEINLSKVQTSLSVTSKNKKEIYIVLPIKS